MFHLCFTSTVSSWGHVGTVSYLTTLFLRNSFISSLLVSSAHSFWPVTDNLLFSDQRKRENPRKTDARFYIGSVCIQSGHATNRATTLGVRIPKMWVWEGAIDGIHTNSDILLK